ncbi:MAG: LPS biosynthesis glycosyltransferase [Leptolyngbya sp. SIO3F4]|nr:LPS biosynthesis glycosyltransferase [Leptolyngbya sp. SIO3F4]
MIQPLVDCIDQTFIVAYKEDTGQLTSFLNNAGCRVEVLRQVHRSEYKNYSRSYLCLLNHRKAWERALLSAQPTLIIEADFVPVANFSQLPPPYDPTEQQLGIAWLYTCASQIYHITQNGYAQGYSTAMVAYVVTQQSAWRLIELAESIKAEPGPETYTPWDSGIEYYLRDRNFNNYVPWRNYGEHGGIPNPEHQQNNLSTTHRADVLYGPLAFAPCYDDIAKERTYGRIKGMGRLLLNKYLRGQVLRDSDQPLKLLKFAISRQLTPRL